MTRYRFCKTGYPYFLWALDWQVLFFWSLTSEQLPFTLNTVHITIYFTFCTSEEHWGMTKKKREIKK